MADNTTIEWTDATWNPIGGCTRVDEGCRNCYAEVMAARFSGPGQWAEGLAKMVKLPDGRTDHRWTGKMVLHEKALDRPLRWRKPRRIFVNSTSDLFHENVPDDWIDRVFAVMALAVQHTFQVLTKRPDRARAYLEDLRRPHREREIKDAGRKAGALVGDMGWIGRRITALPLPNVWLGTSISDQASADARIPHLLATPAAVRFVSAEPLLGPVDLTAVKHPQYSEVCALSGYLGNGMYGEYGPRLDWVIGGGESGPGARVWPGFADAARSLRDQCQAAGVPFFMKQMAGVRKSAMPPIPDDLMVREFPQ